MKIHVEMELLLKNRSCPKVVPQTNFGRQECMIPPLPTVVLTGTHFGSHKWSCFSILTAEKLSRHIQAMYMGEINRKDIATHAGYKITDKTNSNGFLKNFYFKTLVYTVGLFHLFPIQY